MIAILRLTLVLPFTLPLHATQEQAPAFPPASPASQGLSPEALEELADLVHGYLDKDDFVGAELLVLANRRSVLHEFYGHADREQELAWTNQTVCNIRSMTKTLTGAALQILVDRGEVDLDQRVAEYLPGFDNDASREITVKQVLTHRAGLPLTILRDIDDHPDLITMANAVGERGPQFPPDSRFWYSDSGTDVVAAIVEVVAGTTIDAFVHEELLVPLGMTDSFYYLDGDDPRRSRISSLYFGGRGKWQRFLDPDEGPFYPFAWGSQTLYSTPTDYAKFLYMWMDGGMANVSMGNQR